MRKGYWRFGTSSELEAAALHRCSGVSNVGLDT